MAERKKIYVGGIAIGAGAPVPVQSMTNTKTEDVEKTAEQIRGLVAAGCEIVRVAVPNMEAAKAIREIKRKVDVPIVADIHFDYRLALEAINSGVDKIRINPGNIGGEENVKAVADACRKSKVPIRIGVNGGSLEKDLLKKYGGVCAEAMVESALGHVALLNKYDFDDICLSLKASDVERTVAAYRLAYEKTNYPLHLGVTETGTTYMGIIKSAVGIGTLLMEGIGDTIRVSLTAPPVEEVRAGKAILRAAGLRRDGINLISCPSCGRCNINLIELAHQVEEKLENTDKDITVAVMGCAVNGPGEASEADYGVAGGKDVGVLFRKGEIVKQAPADRLADELVELIMKDENL